MNYYKDEEISFNNLPGTCPLHHLRFGILTDIIAPKVKEYRKHIRIGKIEILVKHLTKSNLFACLTQGYSDKSICEFPKEKYYKITKKKMETFIKENNLPLYYLETMLEEQQKGSIHSHKIGEWVKVNTSRGNGHIYFGGGNVKYGIIEDIKRNKDTTITLSLVTDDFTKFRRKVHTKKLEKLINSFDAWECDVIPEDPYVTKEREKHWARCSQQFLRKRELWNNRINGKVLAYLQQNIDDYPQIKELSELAPNPTARHLWLASYVNGFISRLYHFWFHDDSFDIDNYEYWVSFEGIPNFSRDYTCLLRNFILDKRIFD